MPKIPSGADVVDELLEGGYETDVLTTLYGSPATGKTTLCMLAAISRAQEGRKVIYVDAEGGFSVERFAQLAGEERERAFEKIALLRPTSFDEQDKTIHQLSRMLTPSVGLIVVDTLTVFYRLELARAKEYGPLNKRLIWQVSHLAQIARKKEIPVLVTSQVYADLEKDDVKIVGGDILRYTSKCMLKLSKGEPRAIELITHRSIPDGRTADFTIINEGVVQP